MPVYEKQANQVGFKFWLRLRSNSGYLYKFEMYLGKKGSTAFGLGESVILSLCERLKDI